MTDISPYAEMDTDSIPFSQLKAKCIELGLPEFGSRNYLIFRLQAHHRRSQQNHIESRSRASSLNIQDIIRRSDQVLPRLSPRKRSDYIKSKWCLPKSKVVRKFHARATRGLKKVHQRGLRRAWDGDAGRLNNKGGDNEEDDVEFEAEGLIEIENPLVSHGEAPIQAKNAKLPPADPTTPRELKVSFAPTPEELRVEKSRMPGTWFNTPKPPLHSSSMPGSWITSPKKTIMQLDRSTSQKYLNKINQHGKRTHEDSTPQRLAKKPTRDIIIPEEQLRAEVSEAAHKKMLKQRAVQMEYERAYSKVQTAVKKREQEQLAALKEKLAQDLDQKLQPARRARDRRLLQIQEDDEMPQHEKLQRRKDARLNYFELTQDVLEEAKIREDRKIVKLLDRFEQEVKVMMMPAAKAREDKLKLVEEGKL